MNDAINIVVVIMVMVIHSERIRRMSAEHSDEGRVARYNLWMAGATNMSI